MLARGAMNSAPAIPHAATAAGRSVRSSLSSPAKIPIASPIPKRTSASAYATRLQAKHAKIARLITTLADAVNDTKRVLLHRAG